jgi:hypothetical protein
VDKSFTDYINNPKDIIESKVFNFTVISFKILFLLIISSVGMMMTGFQINTFDDLLDWAYWLAVGVALFEQLYANDAAYKYGLFFFSNASDDLTKAEEKSNMLINGAYDEYGNVIKGTDNKPKINQINKPSNIEAAEIAVKRLSEKDKIDHVTKQVNELIGYFENVKVKLELKNKKRYFFPIRIKKKLFWKKDKAINYCEQKIKEGQVYLDEPEMILNIPSKNIKGYNDLDLDDLITNQEEPISNGQESRFYIRNRKKARAKSVGKKFIKKVLFSMLGLGIAWGVFSDINWKQVLYLIALVLIQLGYGLNEARVHVKKYVIVNARRRYNAIQAIYDMIPSINKELKEKANAEALAIKKQELEKEKEELEFENRMTSGSLPELNINLNQRT